MSSFFNNPKALLFGIDDILMTDDNNRKNGSSMDSNSMELCINSSKKEQLDILRNSFLNCNKCELYVGYFTKGGDNVADIQVLADFTVEEVILLGKAIGVPDDIVNKVESMAVIV